MANARHGQESIISPQGRRDTIAVGSFRLASAICIAGALVSIGNIVDGGGRTALAWAIIFTVAAGAFAFGELSWGGRAARAEERRLRISLLKRQHALATASNSDPDGTPPARLVAMMTDNTERLAEYRQVYFGATLAAIMIPFVTLFYIGVAIDPVVGFVVMILAPLIPLGIRGFMLLFRKASSESRKQRGQLSSRYLDAIRNLNTIRLLGAGKRIEEELGRQGEANRGAIMRLLAGNQVVIIVMDGLFSLVLICLTAGLAIMRSDYLTPGESVTIMLLTVLLLEPLQQVAGFFYIGMGGRASQKAIESYLASQSAGPGVAVTPDAGDWIDDQLDIQLEKVRYDHGRGEVLRGVDLEVPRGGRVAIVGRSGAGKSTLMGIIQGTLPPQNGHAAVAGRIIDPHALALTRSLSASVAQSTWMFTGTIADNLRIARQEATETEMWDALERAQVADEIARMPHRLDTHLGEGAAVISGGQAQRISLARALLSGRRLLFLDEPTSHVDIESEARIIDAVANLPRDWTILMITHRPSLLRIADSAYELREGKLGRLELAA